MKVLALTRCLLHRVVKADLGQNDPVLNFTDVVPQHSSDLLQWATAIKVICNPWNTMSMLNLFAGWDLPKGQCPANNGFSNNQAVLSATLAPAA